MKIRKEGKQFNGRTFYCKDGIMSYLSHYDIAICMGGRDIGKSTEWQRFIIKEFIEKGKKFGVVKATEKGLAEFAPHYWSEEWMDKWFPNYQLKYKKKTFYIRRKNEAQKDNENWEECGYGYYLSRTYGKSTTQGQDIDYLLFEEFTNQEGVYLGNAENREKEPAQLLSLYITLNRGAKGKHTRHLKLIMLSNLYSLNNPYFTYLKALDMITNNPNGIYQRFYKYNKKGLRYVLEFVQIPPPKELIAADDNDKGYYFQDYRNSLHILKDKLKECYVQFTFDEKKYINVNYYNDGLAMWMTDKASDEDILIYSCSKYKSINRKIYGIDMLTRQELVLYKKIFSMNKIWYDKLETYILWTNILLMAK